MMGLGDDMCVGLDGDVLLGWMVMCCWVGWLDDESE